jgi:hypothetical protein
MRQRQGTFLVLRDDAQSFRSRRSILRYERTRQALLCGPFVVRMEHFRPLLLLSQPLFQIAFLVGSELDAVVDLVGRALQRTLC